MPTLDLDWCLRLAASAALDKLHRAGDGLVVWARTHMPGASDEEIGSPLAVFPIAITRRSTASRSSGYRVVRVEG